MALTGISATGELSVVGRAGRDLAVEVRLDEQLACGLNRRESYTKAIAETAVARTTKRESCMVAVVVVVVD